MFENFSLSKRAGETHYLCSETATYIGSGKDVKGNNMEYKRRQMRTELRIWPIDRAMTRKNVNRISRTPTAVN